MYLRDCRCRTAVPLAMEHRVTLVTTCRESRIRSNTGRLLSLRLDNMRTIYLGTEGWEGEVAAEKENDSYAPVVLFPSQGSAPAAEVTAKTGKPLNIFVLDTNWGSARKWISKKIFHDMKKVDLKNSYASRYALRRSPNPNHLCTYQSLACLLGETSVHLQAASLDLLDTLDHVMACMARERDESVRQR